MKNKASLSLMEQMVMILVFALAAALCLGGFAKAQTISESTLRRETAAQIAQNGAETLKSGKSLETVQLPKGYTLKFTPENTEIPGLAAGEVVVSYGEETLFSLEAAWQEVLP